MFEKDLWPSVCTSTWFWNTTIDCIAQSFVKLFTEKKWFIENYDFVERLSRATASSCAVSVTFFLVIASFHHALCNGIWLCRNCNSNITCVRVEPNWLYYFLLDERDHATSTARITSADHQAYAADSLMCCGVHVDISALRTKLRIMGIETLPSSPESKGRSSSERERKATLEFMVITGYNI